MSSGLGKTTLYRSLFLLLAFVLLTIAAINVGRLVRSTTDENIFRNPPSDLYFTTDIAAWETKSADGNTASYIDSIRVGDLLLAIDGKEVAFRMAPDSIVNDLPATSVFPVTVFRSKEDRTETVQLQRASLTEGCLRKLPSSVYVQEVTRGGASDVAGMRVGDFILRINGREFSTDLQADSILRQAKSGTTISYEILRDNQTLALPVTLARYGIQFSRLIFVFSGLVFFATGFFIAVQRPNITAARLLGLAFLLIGYFLMVQGTIRGTEIDLFVIARSVFLVFALTFGIAFWIHSGFYFPRERPEILRRKWLVRTPYVIATVLLVLLSLLVFNILTNTLFIQLLFGILFLALCLSGLLVKLWHRKSKTREFAKLNRAIQWTTISALVASLIHAALLISSGNRQQVGFVFFPLAFIPLAYLYTIGRYQLLDLNIKVRRNIQYLIVSWLWHIGLFASLAWALFSLPSMYIDIPNIRFTGTAIEFLDIPPDPNLHDFLEKLILIFLALALTFLGIRLAKGGQKLLNRFFDRKQYDLGRATGELVEVMATRPGMTDLARGIVEKLARLMQLKRVGVLFFRKEKDCCCHDAYGFESSMWDSFCMTIAHTLLQNLKRLKSESRFSIEYLQDELKEQFAKQGFQHVIPIRFKNRLVGAFLVGEKLSESPLDMNDLTFLAAVARQASIAIENAFLYEELTEKERLKHEMAIARRIQIASLPQRTPDVCGLDIAGVSIPALEVGGDYFDYLNGADRTFTVIVGDVSGKGTSAALYMSKVQGILRSLFQFNLSPRDLFVKANTLLYQDLEKQSFITAIGAAIDTKARKLTLARAGHLPLYYFISKQQRVEALTPKGMGLGLEKNDSFATELEEICVEYHSEDIFLFVTDGVTEAQQADGREFGEQRLKDLLVANRAQSANFIRDTIIREVEYFCENTFQHDDQTVVVVKVR